MKAAEIKIQRRNTREFIEANPSTVILNRLSGITDDGAGGITLSGAPTTQPGQRVRVIPQSNGFQRQSIEGEEIQTTHVIVGDTDVVIQRGDFFWLNDEKIEVTFLWPPNQYEVRAEAASRG